MGRHEKEKVWAKIVEEFNGTSGEVYRDKKGLMAKYENLKKSMKKKACSKKKYASGTWGGPSKPSDYSDIDTRVRDLLGDGEGWKAYHRCLTTMLNLMEVSILILTYNNI